MQEHGTEKSGNTGLGSPGKKNRKKKKQPETLKQGFRLFTLRADNGSRTRLSSLGS